MKTLKPQHLRDADFADMEDQLKRIFYQIIFRPLSEVAARFTPLPLDAGKRLLNANEDALRSALRSGRVQYSGGVFSGELSAAITKVLRSIGARFDKRQKVYTIDQSVAPGWVKAEAAVYKQTAKDANAALKSKLDELQKNLKESVNIYVVQPEATVAQIEKGFALSAKALAVQPHLAADSVERLSREYTENMKLWIEKFSQESIEGLRGIVEDNAMDGYRFDKLVAQIKSRYGVTTNKAKFLARQETALFMSKYRKERFMESGVQRYKWSTSHDARVRPAKGQSHANNHRILDGRIFFYKDPPVVDTATNRRANPGEDYNCRCVDIPILEAAA